MTGYGEEREGDSISSFPLPFLLPFCFFAPALTFAHLETLATQATLPKMEPSCIIGHVLYIGEWQKRGGVGTSLRPKQSILLPRLCGPKSFQDQPLLSKTSQRMIDIFIFSFQEDLFAKSTFFLLAFSHKNVEQIQWHITITLRKKYSPGKKTPLEKDKVSILCTHPFFCDSYLLLLPPAAFLALPCKKNCTQEQSFLFSTLILRPALKNNLKNCSQPRSFSKRRDMPLP